MYCEEDACVERPEGIEAVWLILSSKDKELQAVKKILVGGVYISPRSRAKQDTIDHIIETMFYVQSKCECQVRFIISGDFNKVDIHDVLESNGALNQICSVATRNSTTLELVITDIATMFHPPTTLPPFEQDKNSKGKSSNHNVIIVAPKVDPKYKLERHKKVIHIRPQPTFKVAEFMRDVGTKNWNAVFDSLNKHLVEKTVKMTSLDKPWFNPALKMKFNEMQKEYFKNRKSVKWKKLRKNFRCSRNFGN